MLKNRARNCMFTWSPLSGILFQGAHIPGEHARPAQYPLTQGPERTGGFRSRAAPLNHLCQWPDTPQPVWPPTRIEQPGAVASVVNLVIRLETWDGTHPVGALCAS